MVETIEEGNKLPEGRSKEKVRLARRKAADIIEREEIEEITEEVFDDTCKLKLREMTKAVEFLIQQIKAYNEVYMQSLEDRNKHVLQYLSSDKGIFFKRVSKKYVGFIAK